MERLEQSILDIADLSRVSDLSLSTSAAQTAALSANNRITRYDVICDVECYIQVAADASGVTTSNGYVLPASTMLTLVVPTGYKIGGILASGTGTLKIHPVNHW